MTRCDHAWSARAFARRREWPHRHVAGLLALQDRRRVDSCSAVDRHALERRLLALVFVAQPQAVERAEHVALVHHVAALAEVVPAAGA
jgi:hypothetical protein